MMQRIVCLLIGYLFGCFLTAEVVARCKTGKPAYRIGSGNPGMANVIRELGVPAGAVVLAGDLLKTFAAGGLCLLLFPALRPGRLAVLYAGVGTCLGHNYPFWQIRHGGKGVAVTCCTIFDTMPLWGLIANIVGMLVVFATGYLPLGAVVITTVFLIPAACFGGLETFLLAAVLDLLMLLRHRHGLKRILQGTEKRNMQLFHRHNQERNIKDTNGKV